MSYRIFYSWQSDLPEKENRFLIRDVISKSTKQSDFFLDEATRDTPGSPDIVETIFDKLDESIILIADISIINNDKEGRKTPNPNVLLELGYAANLLRWDNIILLFNTAYGKVEDLPFDLRNRRVITFFSTSKELKKDVINKLLPTLKSLIEEINPLNVEERKHILTRYNNQSSRIQRLAIKQPTDWNITIAIELLEKLCSDLSREQLLIENGIYFSIEELLNFDSILNKAKECNVFFMKFIHAFEKILHKEIIEAVNSDDPIKILDGVGVLRLISFKYLKFESEIANIECPKKIKGFISEYTKGSPVLIKVINKLRRRLIYLREKDENINPGLIKSSDLNFVDFDKVMMEMNEIVEYITNYSIANNGDYPTE